MLRRLAIFALVSIVVACAPRGTITLYPAAAAVGLVEPIFVATSRGRQPGIQMFDNRRDMTMSFARFDISIPPDRKTGSVTFPRGKEPNPKRDMLTVDEMLFTNSETFSAAFNRHLATTADRRAIVFVHGFNTNFAEGVYRIAQMKHDMSLPGTIVHFSWPSLGNAFGYVHDRDSVVFSRDDLEALIDTLGKSNARSIVLMAHSMGTYLAMETLRSMALRGDSPGFRKLEAVILISPDIDVDVFKTQIRVLDPVPEPFVIFGSPRDKALKLSSILVAEPARLGNLKDTSVLDGLPVTYIDVQAFKDGSSHFPLATSPDLIQVMNGFADADSWLNSDEGRTANPLYGLLKAAGKASEIVLAPANLVSEAITSSGTERTFEVPADAATLAPPTTSPSQ